MTLGPVALDPADWPPIEETLCGHIRGYGFDTWARAATWTCVGCLLPDDSDRSLSLYFIVGVTEGTVPLWDVYADLGG